MVAATPSPAGFVAGSKNWAAVIADRLRPMRAAIWNETPSRVLLPEPTPRGGSNPEQDNAKNKEPDLVARPRQTAQTITQMSGANTNVFRQY
jgi:hypothetical protein